MRGLAAARPGSSRTARRRAGSSRSSSSCRRTGRSGARSGRVMWRKLLPAAGAVEARRLVQLLGDALQPGDEDDHVVAEVLPHRHAG